MNDSNMIGTGIHNAVPQDSVNKETKAMTTRSAIGAKAQTILEFLRACSPYEADSIRVMVGYSTGKGDIETIEPTDMLAVNRFLNHGLTRESGTSSETVIRYRQERVQRLMEAVKGFVDIGQLCRISVALMKISSDFKAVEEARQHLQSQPSTNGGKN